MKQKLSSFLNIFNILQTPPILKTDQRFQTFNLCTLLVSLGLLGLFFYFFFSNIIALSEQNNIVSHVTQKKLLNDQPFKISPLFAFSIHGLNIELSNYFNIKISAVKKKNFIYYQRLPIEISKCDISQWSKLIDKQELDFYGISGLYCPKLTNESFIGGTYYSANSSSIQFALIGCNQSQVYAQPCFDFSSTGEKYRVNFFFIDQMINQNSKQPIKYFINTKYYGNLGQSNYYYQLQLELQYFHIHTDDSLFFSLSDNFVQGASLLSSNLYDLSNKEGQQYFFNLRIQMSERFKVYNRKVDKIQNVFALSGGFLFIIFVLARLVLNMSMAINHFRSDDDLVRTSQISFFKYVKFLAYRFLGLQKKCQSRVQDCWRISRSLKQISSVTDFNSLIRRVHQLQKGVKQLSSSQQFTCLSLIMPSSLKQFQNQRLENEYFHFVTTNRNKITLWEIRKAFHTIDISLEELYEKLSHRHNLVILAVIQKNPQHLVGPDGDEININEVIQSASGLKSGELKHHMENENMRIQRGPNEKKRAKSKFSLIEKVISLFQDIKKEALQLNLPQELEEVEQKIAISFRNMKSESRCNFQETIPIIILHRLILIISRQKQKKRQISKDKIEERPKFPEQIVSFQTLCMKKTPDEQKFEQPLMKRDTVKYKRIEQRKQQVFEEPKTSYGRIQQDCH